MMPMVSMMPMTEVDEMSFIDLLPTTHDEFELFARSFLVA